MRPLMQVLKFGMCGAALLAFGVAKAGEAARTVADYAVIEADARIPATRSINSYRILDSDVLLIGAGPSGLYMAQLDGTCARAARFDTSIAIDARGGGGVDRFAQVIVNGRRCRIETLSRVEHREQSGAAE